MRVNQWPDFEKWSTSLAIALYFYETIGLIMDGLKKQIIQVDTAELEIQFWFLIYIYSF